MHLHFLGICGTFMGSLALIARELGHRVSGSDQHVYPPMSTQLRQAGVNIMDGYDPDHLQPAPDLVIVGNAMSRGNPAVEYMLERNLDYISGPEFLRTQVLNTRWVLAVSGTHGKTTTTSMLTWILEQAGMSPGYLIGGVPLGFERSARLGESDFFVIEADEYDTAFFDKRSKFLHYRPRTLIINNLEFDHADIFPTLADIQRQFHHVVRLVPGSGQIIYPAGVAAIDEVLEQGCWSEQVRLGERWRCESLTDDASAFSVTLDNVYVGEVIWSLAGRYNMMNALAAIAAAHHVGVLPAAAIEALSGFAGVRRRLETIVDSGNLRIYDDFAHHPTAIEETLTAVRARHGDARIIAVIEPGSNTMKQGVHKNRLLPATAAADYVLWANSPGVDGWLQPLIDSADIGHRLCEDQAELLISLAALEQTADDPQNVVIVLMSNGSFGGLAGKLRQQHESRDSH